MSTPSRTAWATFGVTAAAGAAVAVDLGRRILATTWAVSIVLVSYSPDASRAAPRP